MSGSKNLKRKFDETENFQDHEFISEYDFEDPNVDINFQRDPETLSQLRESCLSFEDLENFFIKVTVLNSVPRKTYMSYWNAICVAYNMTCVKAFEDLPKARTLIEKFKRTAEIPKISLCAEYRNNDGVVRKIENVDHLQNPEKGEKIQFESAHVKIEDVIKVHKQLHPNSNPQEILLSQDGFQPARSASASSKALVGKFYDCREIYLIAYQKPKTRDVKFDKNRPLQRALEECNKLKLRIKDVSADRVERSLLQGQTSHNSRFGCDVCVCETKNINGSNVYPMDTSMDADHRSNEWADALTSQPNFKEFPMSVKKGQVERSILHDANEFDKKKKFDVILNIVKDKMHSQDGGKVSRL